MICYSVCVCVCMCLCVSLCVVGMFANRNGHIMWSTNLKKFLSAGILALYSLCSVYVCPSIVYIRMLLCVCVCVCMCCLLVWVRIFVEWGPSSAVSACSDMQLTGWGVCDKEKNFECLFFCNSYSILWCMKHSVIIALIRSAWNETTLGHAPFEYLPAAFFEYISAHLSWISVFFKTVCVRLRPYGFILSPSFSLCWSLFLYCFLWFLFTPPSVLRMPLSSLTGNTLLASWKEDTQRRLRVFL